MPERILRGVIKCGYTFLGASPRPSPRERVRWNERCALPFFDAYIHYYVKVGKGFEGGWKVDTPIFS
jgi:hypothetical protein